MAPSARGFPVIKAVRTFVVPGGGSGGDYHNVEGGHWLDDSPISTPMSGWEKYRASRTSWGSNVLGSFCVEIEASDGTLGFATGFGGPPACWLVHQHFERFLISADPRDTNHLFEQMYRASLFYGRKGLPVAVISVIDLALWDLLGKIRDEPVYKLIGGASRQTLDFYCTTPDPPSAKANGFWGAKVPLPHCPDEGPAGLRKNIDVLRRHRASVGPDFPLMVACHTSLDVAYTTDLVSGCADLAIHWWEDCLSPDDSAGFALLKRAHPRAKFAAGAHEHSRYGFRDLVAARTIDVLQPDVARVGGLSELLAVAAMAAAYDVPLVPRAAGPYGYHFALAQRRAAVHEALANAPDGRAVLPVFGDLFLDEYAPGAGRLDARHLDRPGFGLTVNPKARLVPGRALLLPDPGRALMLKDQRLEMDGEEEHLRRLRMRFE